jgi:hypothetical protein
MCLFLSQFSYRFVLMLQMFILITVFLKFVFVLQMLIFYHQFSYILFSFYMCSLLSQFSKSFVLMLHVFIFYSVFLKFVLMEHLITVFLKFCSRVIGKDDVQRAGSHQRSHLPQDSNQSKVIPFGSFCISFESGLGIPIHFIRIWIQHFRLNTDPDPIRIQGFDDQKMKKITAEKTKFFGSKTTIYLSLGLHKGRQNFKVVFSSQKRTSST